MVVIGWTIGISDQDYTLLPDLVLKSGLAGSHAMLEQQKLLIAFGSYGSMAGLEKVMQYPNIWGSGDCFEVLLN